MIRASRWFMFLLLALGAITGRAGWAQSPDIALALTASTLTPVVNSSITFKLTATHRGSTPATAVIATFKLSPRYQFLSASGAGTYSATVGTWTIGALGPGAGATLEVKATVLGSGDPNVTATLTSVNPADANAANDKVALTVTPGANAVDIVVTGRSSVASPRVGDQIVLAAVAQNNGPANALSAYVQLTLGSGLRFVSATGQGNYDSSTGRWTVGTLNQGQQATLEVTVQVIGSGTLTFRGAVAGATPLDMPSAGDVFTLALNVPAATIDLTARLSVDQATPLVGERVVFTAVVSNIGTSTANDIVATLAIPSGYTFVSAVGPGRYANTSGQWTIGALAPAASVTLQLTLTVAATGSYAMTLATSYFLDINTVNDRSTVATVPVTPSADIGLTARIDNPVPLVGDTVVFKLVARHEGVGVSVRGLTVDFPLTAGYTFVSADGAYDKGTGVWSVGDLTPGQSATLNVTASLLATGPYLLTATRRPTLAPDPNPANDKVQIGPNPSGATVDLAVQLGVDRTAAYVNEPIVFTVRVKNLSRSAGATDVSVLFLVPATVYAYVAHTAQRGTYTASSGLWDIGSLPAGTEVTLTVRTTALSNAYTESTAALRSALPLDSNTTNNTAKVSTRIPNHSLAYTIAVDVTQPAPGQTVTFTALIGNLGGDDTREVQVSLPLPDGFSFVDAKASSGSYAASSGLWTIPRLVANGPKAKLDIRARTVPPRNYTLESTVTAAPGLYTIQIPGGSSVTASPSPR